MTVTIISIATNLKDLKLPVVGVVSIIIAMSTLVNIDLYNLDIQLLKNNYSAHATSQISSKQSHLTSQLSTQPRPSIAKGLIEEPESPVV